MNKLFSTKNTVTMAIYTAIATVLSIFPHIHTPFGALLTIEFSDVPVVLAAFYMHPVCAVIVAVIKTLIHLGFTETGFIGEAVTLIQVLIFLIPFFFFRSKRSHGVLAAKLSISLATNILYGMAAGMIVLSSFIQISQEGLLPVLAAFYSVRGAVIALTVFLIAIGAHRYFITQPMLYLTKKGETMAKHAIDLTQPFLSKNVRDTERFAAAVAETLHEGDVLELIGDLGAGKTAFTKGLGKAFGIPSEQILSPTFVLCRTYEGNIRLHHADLYRVESADEAAEAGVTEHIGDGIFVVEWADAIRGLLPPHKTVTITKGDGDRRTLEVGQA